MKTKSNKKMIMGIVAAVSVVILAIVIVVAIDSSKNTKKTTTEESTTTEIVTTEESREGQSISRWTGEWVSDEQYNNRPIAVMINNIADAMPQSGVENADIVYEMLVEGGITRLMGIFTDYADLAKIGPVRSARCTYVSVANEYRSVYVHFGGSEDGYDKIDEYDMEDFDGLTDSNGVFYRDTNRVAPHNAYVNGETITNGFASTGYNTTFSDSTKDKFSFNKDDIELTDGIDANVVTTAFSGYQTPYFVYDTNTKLYNRFQYGEAQIDDLTNNQLTFKNIIVQFVEEYDLDAGGHQFMNVVSSGSGYYITDGKYISITWKKDSENSPTKYYLEDGTELNLNPGKSWITLFPSNRFGDVIIE